MRPVTLDLESFRSWEHGSFRFTDGVTAICGANGNGKSSIPLGLEACLFGENLAELLTWDGASTEMEATLVFEHAGRVYRVRRHYSARRGGRQTLDLEERNDAHDVWVSLSCGTMTATQARLRQIIGFGLKTFRASAWLSQHGASFTTADDSDRKKILADVLDLELWARLLERAKKERADIEKTQLGPLVAERDGIRGQLAARSDTVEKHREAAARLAALRAQQDDSEKGLASLRQDIEAHDAAQAAAEEAGREVAHLERQAGRERELVDQADRAIVELNARLAEKATLEQQAERVPDLQRELAEAAEERRTYDAQVAQLRRLEDTYGQATGDLESRRDDLGAAENSVADLTAALSEIREREDATCASCGQALLGDPRAKAIETAEQTLADARARVAAEARRVAEAERNVAEADAALSSFTLATLPDTMPRLEQELAAAQSAQVKLAALAEAEQRLTDARAQANRASEALDDLAPAMDRAQARLDETRAALALLGDRANLDHRHRAAHAAAMNLHRQIEEAAAAAARLEGVLGHLDEQEAKLPALDARHADLAATVRAIATLEKAYGQNGIPALILETTAIPALEQDATRLLRDLGLDRRVELRTQTVQKTTDTLKEGLKVVVITPTGAESSWRQLSTGELTRLDLALRIALARLIARRPGAELGILSLDEPEGLDEQGRHALAGILRALDEFPVRIVVSHHHDLRDAFDRSIVVERDHSGRSRISVAAASGLVAA